MIRRSLFATTLPLLAAGMLTPATASALDFQFEGDVGIHFADFGDLESGGSISGTVDILPQVRLRGDFTSLGQLDRLNFGAGYVLPMDRAELEFGYYYEFWDFNGPFEDDAYAGYGRFAYDVIDNLKLFGSLEYASFKNFDDSVAIFGLGAEYGITEQFAVDFEADLYNNEDLIDETYVQLGAKYRF